MFIMANIKTNYFRLNERHSPKIENYLTQIRTGKIGSDKARIILHLMHNGPKTIEHLILIGFKIQTLSARLSDLEDEGLIYKKADNHGGYSWFYLEENVAKQDLLRKSRLAEKRMSWLKRGLENSFLTKQQHDELAKQIL